MRIDFWKYQGTGNDFVLINNSDGSLIHNAALARKLCDRHFGIGSDGLIILERSTDADFHMTFYNPDGSQSFCGNGSRCAVKFASGQGIIQSSLTTFISTDGAHTAEILNGIIELQMKDPVFPECPYRETELPLTDIMLVHTGSPHLILVLDPAYLLDQLDVKHHGARIRYSEPFRKEGVNVNFISIRDNHHIDIRTYERGVEDETLSCGTGVTASAIAVHSMQKLKTDGDITIHVKALGGDLSVKFDYAAGNYQSVRLCGPAEEVFRGIFQT